MFDFFYDVDIFLNLDQPSHFSSSGTQQYSMEPNHSVYSNLPNDNLTGKNQADDNVCPQPREIYLRETRT